MLREISLAEVKRHNSFKSDWIVIHNEVYDVTKYLSEHPGGEDTLLEVAGQVATQSFEDIGHSDDAREIMKKYKIGALPANEHSFTNIDALKVGTILRPSPIRDMCDCDEVCQATELPVPPPVPPKPPPSPPPPPPPRKRAPRLAKSPSTPRVERRVNSIVVPRERTRIPRRISRRRSSIAPDSSNWWKWALLLLASAITVGLIVKKKMA